MQNQMKIYSDSLETNTCIASLIKAEVLSWTAKFNIGYNTDTLHVCVYSNSRNDVPRVAQRYGTIAAHTRRRASVLVVFVVFACTCTVLPV